MKYWFSEDRSVRLYNDDCLNVMDNLINMNVKVDLVVCDPAYKVTQRGGSGNSGGMCKSKAFRSGNVFKHNDCDIEEWLPKVYKLLKDSSHCYIMTNHRNLINYLNVAEKVGLHFIKSLIWDKGNKIMGQGYMSQFEYILFFRKGKHKKINNCGTSDILSVYNKKTKDANGKNLHDTEKPVELMKILIDNSSNKNDTVLDFMMGIGSTGVACKELNRNFIGIELDGKYFDIARERIENEI